MPWATRARHALLPGVRELVGKRRFFSVTCDCQIIALRNLKCLGRVASGLPVMPVTIDTVPADPVPRKKYRPCGDPHVPLTARSASVTKRCKLSILPYLSGGVCGIGGG